MDVVLSLPIHTPTKPHPHSASSTHSILQDPRLILPPTTQTAKRQSQHQTTNQDPNPSPDPDQETRSLSRPPTPDGKQRTGHPVRLILHPITFRRLAFKGPSAVFLLACQLSSSLLHPTSTIFLHIYSWLPRSLAANPLPVSDWGEDISKSKPFKRKCSS
ncbi:hypothetical protein CRENBAI_010927 [Crenichthys baileyi]|uniref:Uncharacterized protein n=1 Tax=Crenichthys baileyi TaxID=28760 RepID=A0AAV9SS24_9TELE